MLEFTINILNGERQINKLFIKKKKKIGLLILFLHSKHCKSSRGPEVVACVCVCVCVCCAQQQGGRVGPVSPL